jgi:CubicO group peptidase (beta-lactamase class C family)
MKNILLIIFCLFSLLSCEKISLETGQKDQFIQKIMKQKRIPGLSIVMIKDFQINKVSNYGYADVNSKLEINNNTLFQAASISKAVTAAAVWKSIEKGIIKEEALANSLLKDFKLTGNAAADQVSIGDLLTHSGGISVSGFTGYKKNELVPSVLEILNGQKPANNLKIEVFTRPKLGFNYSGGGYTVLQKLMEDTHASKPFNTVLKDNVLNPIGMQNSFFGAMTSDKSSNACTGYSWAGVKLPSGTHTYPELAAAGLWTTSTDLAKFIIAIQKSNQNTTGNYLLKSTADKFLKPRFKNSETEQMAYGVFLENKGQANANYFFHTGSNDGFSTLAYGHLTKGYGIIIMANRYNAYATIEEIKNAFGKEALWEGF